jgi:Fe(3+) dicitrate transport protein
MILNTKTHKLPSTSRHLLTLAACGSSLILTSQAQDALVTLQPLTVLGDKEEIIHQTGSAAFITAEEIRDANTGNINQVMAKVPGVYVREEDGFGNFPNISLRGADGTRSEKTTVMVDGILAAPAPYSGPAAYSTPRVARMSGVEILKGSSQIRYGPHTTGGVINYLTTPIPEENTFYSRATYGSDNTFLGHLYYGDTVQTEAGKVGYLLELFGNSSDGFRDIDNSSRNTGFSVFEPTLKLSFEPDTALKQRFEFSYGYSSFEADETYTGLTQTDLRADPNRRYAATLYDNIDTEGHRTYLKWIAEPTDAIRFESAIYYNQFSRNWYKLDKATDAFGNRRNLHEILAPANGFTTNLGVLQGTSPGFIEVKANNRSYEAYGWQNQANFSFETGAAEHDLAVGLRFHYDHQKRDHWMDTYTADGAGNFNFAGTTTVGQDNRLEEIFATALFIEDTITLGNLTLRPGIRYEWLDLDERKTTNAVAGPPAVPASTTFNSGDETLLSGGMSANYALNDSNSVFGGIYQGVSSPGVSDYLGGVEEERAIGYELGYRHQREATAFELTGFYTDFRNLISTDAGLAGALTLNAGAADVYGLETSIQHDAGHTHNLGFGIPVYLAATWTHATFSGTTPGLAGGGDGVYAGGRDGNEIPYVPEWKLATGVGVSMEKWGVSLDATYSSSTWGTGFNDDPRPAGSTATSRDGKIDPLLLFHLNGHYQLTDNVKLIAGIQNLFDEQGIVSRIPEGPRANAPRMIYAGFEASF